MLQKCPVADQGRVSPNCFPLPRVRLLLPPPPSAWPTRICPQNVAPCRRPPCLPRLCHRLSFCALARQCRHRGCLPYILEWPAAQMLPSLLAVAIGVSQPPPPPPPFLAAAIVEPQSSASVRPMRKKKQPLPLLLLSPFSSFCFGSFESSPLLHVILLRFRF